MTTLLRIDVSARAQGSYSRRVADRLEAAWRAAHPGGRVVGRDLAAAPPPHLDGAALDGGRAVALIDELITELRGADDLLISTALYNFGVPSPLKAWFDHVIRAGRTFTMRDGAYQPLQQGRAAYVVAARGAIPGGACSEDFQLPYLRAALGFLGWPRLSIVEIAGTRTPEAAARFAAALTEADAVGGAP
jgi:FMN-dependent NADH-azoreductase